MPRRLGGFRLQGRTGAARAAARALAVACGATLAGGLVAACGDREATAGASTPPAADGSRGALPDGTAPPGNTSPAGGPTPATPAAAVPAPSAPPADGAPRMLNPEPPFRYPAPLYARRVQGNVTLRLWVDAAGAVRPESTRVAEPSGYPPLDSAAVAGAERLRFAPAVRAGRPHGTPVLFPVYFRHPEAPPLPGDSVLGRPRR